MIFPGNDWLIYSMISVNPESGEHQNMNSLTAWLIQIINNNSSFINISTQKLFSLSSQKSKS